MRRLTALILAGIIFMPVAALAETITIVADRWCPYNCEPGSNHPGLMVEIAQKAFARHNIAVEYSVMPWTRAIQETRLNKHTAIVGAAHKDAPDFIFPATPQGLMHNVFYIRKDDKWRYTGAKSLPQVSLGVISDYSYNDELDQYIASHKNDPKYIQVISGDNALDSNVKKLLAGRIGAFVEGRYVVGYYLAQHNLVGQVAEGGSLPASGNDNLFIAFSPKDPKAKFYANILAQETATMRSSGELQKILASYNVTDWQK